MAVPRAHYLFCCSSLQRRPLIVAPWPTHATALFLACTTPWLVCCYHANFVARAYMPVFVLQLAYGALAFFGWTQQRRKNTVKV